MADDETVILIEHDPLDRTETLGYVERGSERGWSCVIRSRDIAPLPTGQSGGV
jgi:hypothetical protein